MDQNHQSDDSIFFIPVKKNAKYYRSEARARLAGKWKTGFLVSFLAILLGATGTTLFFTPSIDTELLESIPSEELALLLPYLPLIAFIVTVSAVIAFAFSLFVSGPTELGYHRFHLEVIDQNHEAVTVRTLFGFFSRHYFKGVLLRLLRTLITHLTALPLLVGTVISALYVRSVLLISPTMGAFLTATFIAGTIVSACSLVTILITLPVFYMYTFAPFIMSEYPEISAIEAMRNSRHLTKGHKWKLFCLDMSFIGWILLGALACGIGLIFVFPYLQTARALFYHDISGRETAKEAEFPSLDPDDYTPAE